MTERLPTNPAFTPADWTDYNGAAGSATITVLFNDVPAAARYANAFSLFTQYGITAGCGNNDFCPGQHVTRAQMAVFIISAIYGSNTFAYSPTPHFADVGTTAFGFKWIQAMYELGITAGCGSGLLSERPGDAGLDDALHYRGSLRGWSQFHVSNNALFHRRTGHRWRFQVCTANEPGRHHGRMHHNDLRPYAPVMRGQMAVFMMAGLFNQLLPAGTPVITGNQSFHASSGKFGYFHDQGCKYEFRAGNDDVECDTRGDNWSPHGQ
jgi:hypothetical protein